VKVLLDCSPAKLFAYRERYAFDFWQLRTPLTQYARAPGVPWALDNGCFAHFDRPRWERMLDEADEDRPIFVTMPDVVGDAQRTAELFEAFWQRTQELPRALVLQDGIGRVRIPWADIVGVFIGGSDAFKYSPEAIAAAKTAVMLGKWVHVGRVNAAPRLQNWLGRAHSIDGSGISRFDHMLEDVLRTIAGGHPQRDLLERVP
jgi:hypothetical protein